MSRLKACNTQSKLFEICEQVCIQLPIIDVSVVAVKINVVDKGLIPTRRHMSLRTVVPGRSQSLRCTDEMTTRAPPADQNKVIRTCGSKYPIGYLPRDGNDGLVAGSRLGGRNCCEHGIYPRRFNILTLDVDITGLGSFVVVMVIYLSV